MVCAFHALYVNKEGKDGIHSRLNECRYGAAAVMGRFAPCKEERCARLQRIRIKRLVGFVLTNVDVSGRLFRRRVSGGSE